MANEIVASEAFKNAKPSQAFAALDPAAESLSDGIGSSYAVVGYKGKVWSLRSQGEKHTFVRPDDGTPAGYIDVIILRQAQVKSKSFYEKFDPGSDNDGKRPICASIDGIVPDNDVAQKQSETCALCARNVWKTNEDGRKTRECTDYKRLAVLLLPSQTTKMFGTALMEPVFLRIPPASLSNLSVMGDTMANQGFHFSTFITRISFDPNEAHPKMVFRALQPLTDAEGPVVLPLRNDPQALRITGEDQLRKPVSALANPTQGGGASPVLGSLAVTSAPAATVSNVTQNAADLASLDTGLGGVALATPTSSVLNGEVIPPQAVTQTAEDVGEATAADSDLDARIAALMKA
jgi:hypothetical protein